MRRAEMGCRHYQVPLRLGEDGEVEMRAPYLESCWQCSKGLQGFFKTALRLF